MTTTSRPDYPDDPTGHDPTDAHAALPTIAVDIAVVGAGPAGASAANHLARAGRTVLVVDRAAPRRDKCCGDGLTASALRELEALGLQPSRLASWQWVDDVELVGPDGVRRSFPLPRGHGHFSAVATRVDLDDELVTLAKDAGADVRFGHRVVGARQFRDFVELDVTQSELGDSADESPENGERATPRSDVDLRVRAKRVVAADGAWSPTRRFLGTEAAVDHDEKYLGEWHAMRQYYANVQTPESRKLWVWFEPDILPGYVWSFPLANGMVNLGFGVERREHVRTRNMNAIWKSIPDRPHIRAVLGSDAVAQGSPKAWPIPADVIHAPLVDGRVLYVGDAARACDVLTGEGIGQALRTGVFAAEAIVEGDDAEDIADRYSVLVRGALSADDRMSSALAWLMRNRRIANSALALCGATEWTRKNFVRWLFEDYPRGIALTPNRWRKGLMSGPGAYRDLR